MRGAWRGSPPQAFSTSWTGAIAVLREGTYTFATISDDGSAVYIGGRLVVDNRGRHSAISSSGTIRLEPGTHPLLVLYEQDGGDLHFDFLWGRDGASLSTVPPWALWSRNVGGLARLLPGLALAAAYELTRWLAIVLLIALVAVIAWRRMRTWRVPEVPRELKWIVGGSLLLNIAGIWWGLPGHWVAIETLPVYVLYGISQRFSHGWFQAYPPLQYYFLAIASSPILFLQTQGYLTVENPFVAALLIFIYRLVSIAAGVGTVIAAHVCGSQAFSRRAGLFAAAIIALVAPFVHYAKTANVDVPYLFWYGLSLVFYVRMLDSASVRNYVLFGVSAACAICTKDQAYALYLLAPAAMIFDLFRKNREAGVPHPFWRAVIDRRIIATGVALFVTFAACYNLLFNVSGFVGHVRSITDAANAYRVFEPTLGGRWALLRLTVKLIVVSMSWPLFLLGVAGIAIAIARPPLRRISFWLLTAVPAYYFGLINVVLYNYDRFVLPICFLLALFGGLALDSLLASERAGPWRRVAIAAVFAYSLLYAATVDVLMIRDSRYTVERWMARHIGPNDVVGVTGLHEYIPRVEGYRWVDVITIDDLLRQRPKYFVFNADYARAVPPETAWGQLGIGLQNGTLGYRLVLRYRAESILSWLPGAHPDLVGERRETLVFSVLRNINPTIEVFERVQ